MKKIVLSLILTLSIVLSQVAYIPFTANAESNDSVNVTVRVESGGKTIFEKTKVNVTNYDLKPYNVANQEEITALHAVINALKIKNIDIEVFDDSKFGASITSINGINNYSKDYPRGYWAFALNNSYASYSVGKQGVNEGDDITLYYVEDYANADYKYAYFNKENILTDINKPVELSLTSLGQDENWNPVTVPIDNATIMINGEDTNFTTDSNGKVTLPFEKEGNYTITAKKLDKDGKSVISTPYCNIQVGGKDIDAPIIRPTLANRTVNKSDITFGVKTIENSSENITPIVKLNNNVMTKNSDGTYTASLLEGINTISITATDSSGNLNSKNISINYKIVPTEKYSLVEEMNSISNYLKDNNVDEWSAISLNKLGIKSSKEYFDYMVNNFNKNVPKKGLEYYTNVELEKLIMYLASQGYTPYNFNGHDLVKELFNRDINKFDVMDVMFGIFVYDYCNIGDANYKIKLNDLKNELLNKKFTDENGNLGWSLSGKAPIKPDLVGFAVLALSNWEDDTNIKTTIDKAVNTLSSMQNNNGYYHDGFSGGESSEAVSVIILGLTSVGIDPTDAKFTKNQNNLISALMSFKGTNGQYKHTEDGGNDYMATEEALRALIALNKFYESGKYNYYNSDINAKELAIYGKANTDTKEEPTKNTGSKPTSNNSSNNNSTEDKDTPTVVEDAEDETMKAELLGQGDELMQTTAINENKDVKETSKSNKSKLPITSGIITLATGAIAVGAYFMFRKDF
jgi:Domain of unknown function (DUF4430)